jgi:DNA polymerase I-like protein with 3'-5' exonuclease and polymerase domains
MGELDVYAWDLETFLIQPGNLQPQPVIGSFAHGEDSWLDYPSNAALRVKTILGQRHTLVGHNGYFDAGVLVRYQPELLPYFFDGYRNGRIRDTQTRQQIIDIRHGRLNQPRFDGTQGYSLAELELHHLGIDRSAEKEAADSWRLRYSELDDSDLNEWPEDAKKYALDDSKGTLAVYQQQKRYIPAGLSHLPGELEITRSAWALHLMSCHGICTDPEAVARLKKRCLDARKDDAALLESAGLIRPNGTKDMTEIRNVVQGAYAGRKVPRTAKGAVATDRDTLERSGDTRLEALARLSVLDKLLTAFIPALERGARAPLMPSYGIAETGRTTCSAGRGELGINIQQLPRGNPKDKNDPRNFVRECFVPRPGFVFVSVDYDTAELRALAHVCRELFGFSKLGDDLDAGRDPHLAFAAQFIGITYEEAERRYKAGDPELKDARQFGKIFNFGNPGGLGTKTLVEFARTTYDTIITEAQATKLGKVWLKTYPEMPRFFKHVDGLSDCITIPGYGLVRGDVTYTAACNSHFQGLVAAGARDAVFDVAEECYVDKGTALYGSRPVAFIHDELILEVPAEREKAHRAAYRLAEVMCAAMSRRITRVKVTASPVLMTRWYKNAAAKFDADGFLIPWQ